MSQNIEMNYFNGSEYEPLYPLTLKSNITDLTISANEVQAGTFPGQVVANSTSVGNVTTLQIRNIYCGTLDMSAGSSVLPNGQIYLVYE